MSAIDEKNIIDVDDSTILPNTPMMVVETDGKTLAIPLMTKGSGIEQIQADWAQNDDTEVDFIKNKPAIPSKVADLSDAGQYVKQADIKQADWDVTDITSMAYIKNKPEVIPPQSVITNDESGDVTIEHVAANTRRIFTQPLTSLTVQSIEDSNFESELQFTTSDTITVALPSDLRFIGGAVFEPNCNYIINVKNKIAVMGSYE